jgi:hypothetical protein
MGARGLALAAVLLGGCVDLGRPDLVILIDGSPPLDAITAQVDTDGGGSADAADVPDETDVPDEPDGPGDPADTAPDGPDPLPAGSRCDQAGQCASGFCAQGVCCNDACRGTCSVCNLATAPGTCSLVPAGEDPGQSCAEEPLVACGLDGTCDGRGSCRRRAAGTECRPGRCTAGTEYAATTCDGSGTPCPEQTAGTACTSGMCTGSSCAAPCAGDEQCQSGFYCNMGRCTAKLAAGAACDRTGQCTSGFCVDRVCCSSACTETCFACNNPSAPGSCSAVASGQDPRGSCPAEATSTCGRAGGCNGSGACRLHPVNTVCLGGSCSGSSETPARTCDGLGVCRPAGAVRDCAPYLCGASACASTCADSSGCAPGFSCPAGTCARSAGLALLWRFEETSGSTALDSSGNGLHGAYVGETGAPISSTNLPTLVHANTRSRQFAGASRQAVQISLGSALRLSNDFSIAAWYRATQVDTMNGAETGAEIISGANVYILRLRPDRVEFSKDTGPGVVQCPGNVTGFRDGRWHHLAAVASRSSGVRVYYDGSLVCSLSDNDDIAYSEAPANPNLFVGRHGEGETHWDFSGNIDEVRVYSRPLSASEISILAGGRNL